MAAAAGEAAAPTSWSRSGPALPTTTTGGGPGPPFSLDVQDVDWDGYLQRVGERGTEDGLVVVEYDIGQTVEFDVELPAGAPVDPAWNPQPRHVPERVLAGQGPTCPNPTTGANSLSGPTSPLGRPAPGGTV